MSTEPNDKPLNDRQRKFVEHVARGESAPQAARLAGYGSSYSKKSHRLLQCPAVAKELELIRAKSRDLCSYTLASAMQEASDAAAFARACKNGMALVKATELRAKLAGLLIERVEVATVDLRSALDGARDRVLKVIDLAQRVAQHLDASPPSNGSISWAADIPGSAAIEEGQGRT